MDTYSITVTQTDILAARYLVETNAKRGHTSPIYLLRLASIVLPSDQIEGQETLW